MPIAGLTTKEAGFPRLGKIFKGAPKVGNRPGNDLDYFRLESDRPGLKNEFVSLVGEQPKELEVWLPYATPVQNFDPWMREYTTAGLKRKCDGVTQVLHLEGATYSEEPIPCLQRTQGKCNCTRSTALKVIIRDLFALGHCGYFDLMTSSKHDIVHIQEVLNMAYQFKGTLLGIPFKLRRSPQEKSAPVEGKRIKKTYELIQLEIDPAWVAKQFGDRYAAMMGVEAAPVLEASEPRTYAAVQARIEAKQLQSSEAKRKLSPAQERVFALVKLTGHDRASVVALCESLDLPTDSADLTVDDAAVLAKAMLVGRFSAAIEDCENVISAFMAEGATDEQIFNELAVVETEE